MTYRNAKPKVRVNAGGMTESQANKILQLSQEKAWELDPRASYRERVAMLINDIENNPATSPLTGGWNGSASKLIEYLNSCPNVGAEDIAKAVANDQLVRKQITDAQFEENDDGTQGPRILGANDETDPWSDEADNAPVVTSMGRIANGEVQFAAVNDDPTNLVGPGVYIYDGKFYSVKESNANPGRHYAHLISLVEGKFKHKYAPGIIYKLTRQMAADPQIVLAMNMDTMRIDPKTGRKIGSCCVCGRMLTKKASVEAGIGPICGGRIGL